MKDHTKPVQKIKPDKPYPEYPLFPHLSGQWAKKIRGKFHYFGPWNDPGSALQRYLDERDDLYAGRKPRPKTRDDLTVRELLNRYLTTKKLLFDAGELSPRTYSEYKETCARIGIAFGLDRVVDDLTAQDFEALRKYLASRYGLTRLGNEVQRVRSVFKYGVDHGLLTHPIRYGQAFRRPSRKAMRLARNERGPRMFEAKQIRKMIEASSQPLKAMILLAVNCGFGNNDCATLTFDALDLEKGWHTHPRPKTGVERRCPLWPETVAAVKDAIAHRYKHKSPSCAKLVFVTKQGQSWARSKPDSPISRQLAKVLDRLGFRQLGVSFYSLRHVFETIAGESKDQVAVDFIMGHAPPSNDMASVYREKISDQRLKAVTDHVHQWLFGSTVKARKTAVVRKPPRPFPRKRQIPWKHD